MGKEQEKEKEGEREKEKEKREREREEKEKEKLRFTRPANQWLCSANFSPKFLDVSRETFGQHFKKKK